ncbi:hypothetical protein PSP31121_05368 [Pandoraea sputorum]|uniref:Uncharacterized protein n=2 Tax=Pandoraea sputorum TaxID=93222 RepID=A0A5E5BKY6_9BURK|nr:hypothetical protein PSP31121_05368 [Pandoraea sputorum]
MPIIRTNSAPIQRLGENFSLSGRRTKSAPHFDTNASALTHHASAHRVEEEKTASPTQNSRDRTRLNRFLCADDLNNDARPSDDSPFYTTVCNLQALDEFAQMINTRAEKPGDPAYPFNPPGSRATEIPRCLSPASMENKIPPQSNACEIQIEQAEGVKVDILFSRKTFSSKDLKDALPDTKEPVSDFFIELSHCKLTQDDIREIAIFLSSQRDNIQKFRFGAPECNKNNDTVSIAPILDSLFETKHLTELTIDLRNSGFISNNESLLRIHDLLCTHKDLTSLIIATQNNRFSKDVISIFFAGLAQLKKLDTAVLSFPESHNLDEEVLSNVFMNLRELTSVRELQLAVHHNNGLTESSISSLRASLPELKNIEKFGLYVRNSDINQAAIQKVLDAARACENLRELHIDACHCLLNAKNARQSVAEFAAARNIIATIDVSLSDDMAIGERLTAQHLAELARHGLGGEDA